MTITVVWLQAYYGHYWALLSGGRRPTHGAPGCDDCYFYYYDLLWLSLWYLSMLVLKQAQIQAARTSEYGRGKGDGSKRVHGALCCVDGA